MVQIFEVFLGKLSVLPVADSSLNDCYLEHELNELSTTGKILAVPSGVEVICVEVRGDA